MIELSSLGKTYTNREVVTKAMRALPKEWDMKTIAMKEAKDLNKMELHNFFFDLKAFEFEKNARKEEEDGRSFKKQKALVAVKRTWDDSESEGESIR